MCRHIDAYEATVARVPQVMALSSVAEALLHGRAPTDGRKFSFLGPQYVASFVKNDRAEKLATWHAKTCRQGTPASVDMQKMDAPLAQIVFGKKLFRYADSSDDSA